MISKRPGVVKFSDNFDFADTIDESGTTVRRCMVRHSKLFILDKDGTENSSFNVPYGSTIFVNDGDKLESGSILIQWDPYTDIILARETGLVSLNDFIEGETYAVESVEGGKKQMVIVEARDRKLSPHIEIIAEDGKILAGGTILPVKATLVVTNSQNVKRGQTLVKIPKDIGKSRDITGGLPRVAELFEARKPSFPAVMTEINGTVRFGETKRGVRKIFVKGVDEEERSYSIPYGKHVIVHEGDFVNAGTNLCEGAISPADILHVLGPSAVRDYLVNEIQEVYRLQGVKINDKHIEVIVNQMMLKVSVKDPGDTWFLEEDKVSKKEFFFENERISSMVIVNNPGDSDLDSNAMLDRDYFLEVNKNLKAENRALATYKKTTPATFSPILMGITRASLNTESFISAASFQETTRVLTDASTAGKTDYLQGLKENVAVGRLIPAGTGTPKIKDIVVGIADINEDVSDGFSEVSK
jgi:DNA-directed RNA polymerase subunit beta'